MLYVSGPADTLDSLCKSEGYAGNLDQYAQEFAKLNPELCRKYPTYRKRIPAYTFMHLVTYPSLDFQHSTEIASIVNGYTDKERQTLRAMQEDNHNIPSHLTAASILEDFYDFLKSAKHILSYPLFSTSVYQFDRSLTNKSLIKITGESLKHGSKLLESSPKYIDRMTLMELMHRRNEINLEIAQLPKGTSAGTRLKLEKETKALTAQIKKLIPKKVSENAGKYIHGLPAQEARQARANSASAKLASKGAKKIQMTHIERLNKAGLTRYRQMIKGFKVLGDGVKKVATYTNYTLAGYEIVKTIKEGGNAFRTTFREGAAIYTGNVLSAAAGGSLAGLGGIAIGAVTGDVLLGNAILVCYPIIGWVVLVVAGAAVAGYVSYQTKDIAERVWDAVESGYVKEKVYEYAGKIYDEFKYLGQQIVASDS